MSEVAERRDVAARPEALGLAEQKRQDWVLDVPEEHTTEDLCDPAYWSHVAARFQMFDRIEARSDTCKWVAELMVVQAGRNWARVKLIVVHDTTATKGVPSTEPKHAVRLRGPKKWSIVRIKDNVVIQENIATEVDAMAALQQYEHTLANT